MENFRLKIEYNGSAFFGWQKQEEKRTVQGELENAFFVLTGQEVSVEGSGRTDRGVHAFGQVASVKFENKIPLKNLKGALNNLLPPDVYVKKIERVDDEFHARFSAKRKTYRYVVQVGGERSAIEHDRVAYFSYKIDEEKIRLIANMLVGKHNFKAFASADTNVSSFEREIFDIKISKRGRKFVFDVTGNGFLYNMVRIIVGTLLDAGRGKISETDIQKAFETGERKYTGITMPACGLYLLQVEYPKK